MVAYSFYLSPLIILSFASRNTDDAHRKGSGGNAKNPQQAQSRQDLFTAVLDLFQRYKLEQHLQLMGDMRTRFLSEHQFAQLIGKTRLYQYLPQAEKKLLPAMEFTDCHVNAVAKAYYTDENFSCGNNPEISLWKAYNLFTGANKSSYIDTFLDRSLNATQLISGIGNALNGDNQYGWFIG